MAPPPRRRRPGRRPAARDERGAVALFVAALVVVMVGVCALVVDLGMQRVLRSDLQAVADVVALDLVRDLDGRTAATLTSPIETARVASLRRNAAVIGDSEPVVSVELGRMTTAGVFEVVPSTTAPSAVRVTARSSVDYAFASGRGGAVRSAVASSESSACYQLGSYAAQVAAGHSVLLNAALRKIGESNATLSALDYTGLVATGVSLDRLSAELGFGTINELAAATVTVSQYFAALARALPAGGDATHVQVANALSTWAQWRTQPLEVSRILGVSAGSPAVVGATLNLLDLVAGGMFLVNGENFLHLWVSQRLPNFSFSNVQVKLIQGARKYCGAPRTPATTARPTDTEQLNVHVDANLTAVTTEVPLPAIPRILGSAATLRVDQPNWVGLDVSVAPTEASLRDVGCGSGPTTFDVQNGLATIHARTYVNATVIARLDLLGLPLSSIIGGVLPETRLTLGMWIDITATVGQGGPHTVEIAVPPRAYDVAYPTGSSGLQITEAAVDGRISVSAQILGGGGFNLTSAESTAIGQAFASAAARAYFDVARADSILNGPVSPILALAGVDLGGSRITLDGTPRPSCGTPALRG